MTFFMLHRHLDIRISHLRYPVAIQNNNKQIAGCRRCPPRRVYAMEETETAMVHSMYAVDLVKALVWYVAYMYYHRPRGWSRQDLLEIKQSSLGENAGMGVFSKQVIVQDTVLGSYPGFVRNDRDMTAKSIVSPMSRYYCFSTRPGCIIDPTGIDGYPSKYPTPSSGVLSWWPFDVDTTLSYVNEPSINTNVSVNVRVEDDPGDPLVGLIFRADRDIQPGEELFIDYGTQYDRSMYDT